MKEEEQLKQDTQKLLEGLTGIVDLAKVVREYTEMEELTSTIEDLLILLEDVFIYVLEHESRSNNSTYYEFMLH